MKNERRRLNIDELHNKGIKGQGINVAVLDTGILPHLDFVLANNRIIEFYDVDSDTTIPYDNNGHGTAVAGIVAGSGLVSNGLYVGVAPQSGIVGVKVISDNGEADAKAILDGMRYVAQHHIRLNIRVVCMSFGSVPVDPDPIMKGAEVLWRLGIVVVASSGNNGPKPNTICSPGATPTILSVGGIDYDSHNRPFVVSFSSRGPYNGYTRPDIVAPAVNILTTGTTEFYSYMTGTSMSAPIVAGIVALMLGVDKHARPDRIKEILLSSATYVDGDRNSSGHGIVNIDRAMALL